MIDSNIFTLLTKGTNPTHVTEMVPNITPSIQKRIGLPKKLTPVTMLAFKVLFSIGDSFQNNTYNKYMTIRTNFCKPEKHHFSVLLRFSCCYYIVVATKRQEERSIRPYFEGKALLNLSEISPNWPYDQLDVVFSIPIIGRGCYAAVLVVSGL